MDRIELVSGDRNGVEVMEVPEESSVYCNLSYDNLNMFEPSVGIHMWIENLIEDPNPRKGEDCDIWESWISVQNYTRLLNVLDTLSFDSYDDVNENDVAYTPCTSQSAICFVCGENLIYREDDVVSFTRSRGPIYCHENCVDEFYEKLVELEEDMACIISNVL